MEEKTAQKAAKWWADQLRRPAKLDNGDTSAMGAVTFGLAKSLQQSERGVLSDELIDSFEKELSKNILTEDPGCISCDYGPCEILVRSADNVALDLGSTLLPWKTDMLIRANTVSVKYVYRASFQTI